MLRNRTIWRGVTGLSIVGMSIGLSVCVQSAFALSTSEVEQVAQSISVRIKGLDSGSGVIIKHDGQTYTVMTAAHVIEKEDRYEIITQDNQSHPVTNLSIKKFPELDLAIVQFNSPQKYKVAKLGYYPATILDRNTGYQSSTPNVYVYGWPASPEIVQKTNGFLSPGQIMQLSTNLGDGYSMNYSNATWPGMSGGPVLDRDGRVVGIHGRSLAMSVNDTEANLKLKVPLMGNLGISIQTFFKIVDSVAPSLHLSPERLQPNLSSDLQPLEQALPEMNYPKTLMGQAVELYNQAAYLTKDPHQQLALFDQATRIQPDFYPAWFMKGLSLNRLQRSGEALKAIDQGLKFQPKSWYGQIARSIILRQLKSSPKEILEALDRAIRADDNFIPFNKANSLAEKAQYLVEVKQYDLANLAFEEALKITPDNSEILQKKAIYLFGNNRFEEALNIYDRVIKLDPYSASIWLVRGSTLSELKRNSDALDSYSNGIKVGGNNHVLSSLYGRRASIFRDLNQNESAILDYKKSIQLAVDNGSKTLEFLSMAQLQAKLNQNKDALDSYQKSFTLYKDFQQKNPALKDNYLIPYLSLMGRSYIFASMGRYQDALREVEPVLKFIAVIGLV